MFTAIILACHVANADMCMTITDNRGPYETEARCEERIDEIIHDLIGLWMTYRVPMVFKMTSCVMPDKKGLLT